MTEDGTQETASDSPRKRILIVEDDTVIRASVAGLLIEVGCNVETVTNGSDALSVVQQHPPDTILLDMRLPLLSGEQFLALLKFYRDRPPPRIVAMTADHEIAERLRKERDPRITAVIDKPFDLSTLLDALGISFPDEGSPAGK
jgi:CheY-like chemotaxis protein